MSDDAWLSACWLEFLNLAPELRRQVRRGRVMSRKGLVENLEVNPGLVSAELREEHGGHVSVKIRQHVISRKDWDDLLDKVAANAGLAAELLAGRMSEAMTELFVDAGLELFPYELGDVKNYCTCGAPGPACVHTVATHIALAQAFAAAPLLLLAFRGLDQDALFAALRERRATVSVETPSVGHDDVGSRLESIDGLSEGYWGKGELPSMAFHFGEDEIEEDTALPVIRALGQAPSNTQPDDVARVLAPVLAVARARLETLSQVTMDLDPQRDREDNQPEEPALDEILVAAAHRHGSLTSDFVAHALAVNVSKATQYLEWLVEEGRLDSVERPDGKKYVPPRATV